MRSISSRSAALTRDRSDSSLRFNRSRTDSRSFVAVRTPTSAEKRISSSSASAASSSSLLAPTSALSRAMKPPRVLARPSASVRPASCSTNLRRASSWALFGAGARRGLLARGGLGQLARFLRRLGGLARLVVQLALRVGDCALVAIDLGLRAGRRRVARQRLARGLQLLSRLGQLVVRLLLARHALGGRSHLGHHHRQWRRRDSIRLRRWRRRFASHQRSRQQCDEQRRHHQRRDDDSNLQRINADQEQHLPLSGRTKPEARGYSGNAGGAFWLTASSGSGVAPPGCPATAAACHLRLLPVSTPQWVASESHATTW